MSPFGRGLRKEFLLDENYLNLNHGSFGTYPRPVQNVMRSYQEKAEAAPDKFIRYDYPRLLGDSRAALAKLLHAPEETIVLTPNATTGINTVLRSLVYEKDDVIVYFSTIYGSCEKTLEYLTETTPVEAVQVEYTYPVEDAWLVNEFTRVIQNQQASGKRVRIAIFDTVVSLPGVRMPFERLVETCKRLGVLSCIDGAHGIGHVHLDLISLDPDFFVSNCHKWLYVPRGCAVLYVPIRNQHLIRSTLPTSHGFIPQPKPGKSITNPLPPSATSPFVTNFSFVGTIDNSNYLCIPAALEYRASLGGEDAIIKYCWDLARNAAKHYAKVLGTEVMENSTGTLGNCCLSNVSLPLSPKPLNAYVPDKTEAELGILIRDWLTLRMVDEHNTFMALVFYGGAWWVRLSAQAYLDMQDFEQGAEILKDLCERVAKGEFAPNPGPKL